MMQETPVQQKLAQAPHGVFYGCFSLSLPVQGYETLKNPMKKRLYDAYVSNVNVDVPEGMSYAEWEAQQVSMACTA